MIRSLLFLTLILLGVLSPAAAFDEEGRYKPGDPIAAIDGNPIYLGELNLILTERLKMRDLSEVGMPIKQATAALLVRRHLALKSLQQQGGAALDSIVQRQIESISHEATRRGSSLAKRAATQLADERSLIADITWRTAWREYLKSRMNDANLRIFFDREKARYAGGRWQVSQIFIDVDANDEPSVANAQKNMVDLADQLRSSDSLADAFASAALEHSEAGSANEKGMVGWVENDGDLPATVMAVVRKTAPGKISEPVRSPLGMHLVFVHQFQPGKLTFDELVDQGQLRRDAANALFGSLVRRQSDAKIVWFIPALKPPQSIGIVPERQP